MGTELRGSSIPSTGSGKAWLRLEHGSRAIPRAASVIFLCALVVIGVASDARAAEDDVDLTALSLLELMDVEVSSAAKRKQPIGEATAAITIITAEDLRRSGVTSVPEALRMVPGMQVAQINASTWAISARGFTDRFANKMLVLRDGRSLYAPLFGGTFWDQQDILLEDIDRIEVIRGPGGTLWGANAVNGVINIITKPSGQTQGFHVAGLYGNEEQRAEVRYGGEIGESGHFRVYAQAFEIENQVDAAGDEASDGWDFASVGFRTDWDTRQGDRITVQGDGFAGSPVVRTRVTDLNPPFTTIFDDKIDTEGFNVLGRWSRTLDDGAGWNLQTYFDSTTRPGRQYGEKVETIDIELQHRVRIGGRHDLLWNVGARVTSLDLTDGSNTFFDPNKRDDKLFSGFIQDEISFNEDRFRLTLGTKVEHNDYTGFEFQPNIRGLWKATEQSALWAALSRAIRSPSPAFTDVRLNFISFPDPFVPGLVDQIAIFGEKDLESEVMLAYEVGFRGCTGTGFCVDVSAFYNDYDKMLGTVDDSPDPFFETDPLPAHVVIPQLLGNPQTNEALGGEIVLAWNPGERFSAQFWYSYLDLQRGTDPDPTDMRNEEALSARDRFHLRLQYSPNPKWTADVFAYHVDELPLPEALAPVDSYTRVDARVAWRPSDAIEASLVLRNAFDDRHLEFTGDNFAIPTEIERSFFGKLAWHF